MAVALRSGRVHCDRIVVWNLKTLRTRSVPTGTNCPHGATSGGQRLRELALAGTRLGWIEEHNLGNLYGSRSLLAFNSWTVCTPCRPAGCGTRRRDAPAEGDQPELVVEDPRLVLADGDVVLVRPADSREQTVVAGSNAVGAQLVAGGLVYAWNSHRRHRVTFLSGAEIARLFA